MKHAIRDTVLTIGLVLVLGGSLLAETDAKEALKVEKKTYKVSGTLTEVVAQLEKIAGVPVRVAWSEIEGTGVTRTDKVSLSGAKATVSDIIDLVLVDVMKEGKPLGYYVENNVIILTTQARVLSRRTLPAPVSTTTTKTTTTASNSATPKGRDYTFEGIALVDVIEYFRTLTGINFHVNWRSLEAVGLDRQTSVSFKASDITIARAMDLTMTELNADKDKLSSVYWVVDAGVVQVATGSVLETQMRTKVFDVADLLHVVPDFIGPRVSLEGIGQNTDSGTDSGGGGGGLFGGGDEDREEKSPAEKRIEMEETLITTIKESIGEDMWQPEGKGSIKLLRNNLIITQSLLGFKLMRETIGK